ncbi:MAG: hypothetical protein MPJ50_01850 [Pirellulales bacterium]|nr:hypothetical protein [Pirellulales bacterium]
MADLLQTYREMDSMAKALVIGAGVAIVFIVALLLFRRRRLTPKLEPPDLAIDLSSLGTHGPPAGGAQVECYNVPMRLAAVVLAPAGRLNRLPARERWPDLIDQIVPGLKDVVADHDPLVRAWPEQLSAKGFSHLFFSKAKLPGERGKGSPWCSLAGKFESEGEFFMVALILRASKSNSLGEFIMEPTDWLGVIRARSVE